MINNNISRFILLFLLFSTIISGFVTQVISCQTQQFLSLNIYAKHFIGIIMAFSILMMEGGWSFDEEDDKIDRSWKDGNVIDTLIYSVLIYLAFLLSAKMRLYSNLSFYFLLFITYCINTQRLYWYKRNQINHELNSKMEKLVKILLVLAVLILIYGVIDYYKYQKTEYKKDFTLFDFIVGKFECKRSRRKLF